MNPLEDGSTTGQPDITNDAEFTEAFRNGLQEVEEKPTGETAPDDKTGEEKTEVPAILDLDEPDPSETQITQFADFEALLKDEAAIARFELMKPGLAKALEGNKAWQESQPIIKAFNDTKAVFEAVSTGDPSALVAFDRFLASEGYDIAAAAERAGFKPVTVQSALEVLAEQLGEETTPEEIAAMLSLPAISKGQPKATHPKADKAVLDDIAKLKADNEKLLSRFNQEDSAKEAQAWASDSGKKISDWVEAKTGRRYDPLFLASFRSELPTRGLTIEHVEDAVMKHNPQAYRAALSAASGKPSTPTGATVSKGGRSTANPTIDLLDNPDAFVANLRK